MVANRTGGDDVDTKLQHAVTTLNELAATLSAILESRGVETPEPSAEDAPAAEEPPASGGGKRTRKAPAKKAIKKK